MLPRARELRELVALLLRQLCQVGDNRRRARLALLRALSVASSLGELGRRRLERCSQFGLDPRVLLGELLLALRELQKKARAKE